MMTLAVFLSGLSEAVLTAVRAVSAPAAAVAIGTLWQGAVIASGLALCLRLLPRSSAEQRFTLWAAAFATIVSLPVLTFLAGFSSTAGSGVSSALPVAGGPAPLLSLDARWSVAITALWAGVALFRAAGLVINSIRLRKIWRDATPVEFGGGRAMPGLVLENDVCERAEICTTTVLERPCVIGFFKPRILIPDWLFARLTAGELEQIVLHEREHLRRRDDWTNLLQKICVALFPLNPALYFIERRLCREREMACDDGVIAITRAPRAYAACLASLAERGLTRRAEALSLGAWQRRPELVDRVHSILRRTRGLGPVASGAVLSALGCGLVLGSYALARVPRLVAFVPAQSLSAAQGSVADSRQVATARMVNAAYVPVRSAGVERVSSEGRATSRKADGGVSPSAALRAHSDEAERGAGVAGGMPTNTQETQAPGIVMLNAHLDRSQPLQTQEEQWVVVTRWEQVRTSNPNAGLTADYETNASAANEEQDMVARPGAQITVTQLIFRIVPARDSASVAANRDSTSRGSAESTPTKAPMRDGWFVFQL